MQPLQYSDPQNPTVDDESKACWVINNMDHVGFNYTADDLKQAQEIRANFYQNYYQTGRVKGLRGFGDDDYFDA